MNSIKILMALAVVCILATPAFSMPDRGMGPASSDDKQDLCDCPKPMMKDKCQADNPLTNDCQKPGMASEGHQIRSMMGDKCKGDSPMPMMGLENHPIKSMMGNKFHGDHQNPCECPRPMIEEECKEGK